MSFLRLDELSPDDFHGLVLSQDATKMRNFMAIAFNPDRLRSLVRERWLTIYDVHYIDEKIIAGVERNSELVRNTIEEVERRASLNQHLPSQAGPEEEELKQAKQVTEVVPFNLTKQKPKLIPVPEVVNRDVKARPIPKNLNKKSLADI